MCNISAIVFNQHFNYDEFIKGGSKRGTDGFGYAHTYSNLGGKRIFSVHRDMNVTNGINHLTKHVGDNIKVGSIIITNHRAAPETESEVDVGNIYNTVQPVLSNQCLLVHNGAVSNFICNEMNKSGIERYTLIDSEAIIQAYVEHNRNMVKTMEYLSGGFSIIMFDFEREKLIVACSHNPLYCGSVRGYGSFFNSQESLIWKQISIIKNQEISNHNQASFEDYYCRMIKQNTVEEWDISGTINTYSFKPRYVTNTFDTFTIKSKPEKVATLVAASGGLDSTTTLATMQAGELNPIAVHFQYGHRGEGCEHKAIKSITNQLDIPLHVFDLKSIISPLDRGMLTDKNAEIITGTDGGLKTTAAWTVWRNGLFLTTMGALAESLIMNHGYTKIYLTGGMLQLTESGSYPDNTERFLKGFMSFAKSASIVGEYIEPMYGLCNILKTEQYILLDALNWYKDLGKYLVSCDRPKLINGVPHNCSFKGKPACGSGLLSYWGCKMSGLEDTKQYYEVDDFNGYEPKSKLKMKNISVNEIIDKLEIPEWSKHKLRVQTLLTRKE